MRNRLLLILAAATTFPATVFADQIPWTPLITLDDFTGVRTDLLTTVGGIMAALLIIVGIGMLVKVLAR